mmetsp:Transcript_1495/g.3247  ORF Transcript_1495/g.3247 Transcript_1495/m.3247 type:complete len:107 (+) Transcript_1495:33-353(+)
MEDTRSQLWSLIEQITAQIYDLQAQEGESNPELERLAETLQRLLLLHRKYVEMLKDSNLKLLALMRERNLYLEKCRKIEALGNSRGWQGSIWQKLQAALYNNPEDQ